MFGLDGAKVHLLRISVKNIREEEGKLIIDLRLIEEEGNQHYCLIKNISRLLSKQVRKHDGSIHDLYCSKMFESLSK